MIGYEYATFSQDIFKAGEIVWSSATDSTTSKLVWSAYQCNSGVNAWKCSKYAPGIATGQTNAAESTSAWTKIDATNKFLLSRKVVSGSAVFTSKPFGVTASRSYKKAYKAISAIQWSTVGAADTRYSDYAFQFRQFAFHEELTWTCIAADLSLCRSTEPTKDSGSVWELVPFYIVTSVKLVTI